MALPENGFVQPVEVVVGGALPRNGFVQPVEVVSGGVMVVGGPITGGVPGDSLFVDVGSTLGQNSSFLNVKGFGAKGDGVTDDTVAIQNAINAAVAAGGYLFFPAGTYIVSAINSMTDAAGINKAALLMASNMHLIAAPGSVTIKMANNQSTNATPTRISMFFSNQFLSNISFEGISMDMNGANNLISPTRPVSYSFFTQAHIIFSGDVGGGVAAGCTNMYIRACQLLNTAGVSCIVMAQSNTPGVGLGSRWRILDCLFSGNGTDSNDHSSIFAWADDVEVHGCTFIYPTMTLAGSGGAGPNVAYEAHGAQHRFHHNKILNYYQAVWVSGNYTSASIGQEFNDNVITICGVAFDHYRESALFTAMSQIRVHHNLITITDDATIITLKVGIQQVATYTITDEEFDNNTIVKLGNTVGSAGISIGIQTVAGQSHDRIAVHDNAIYNTVLGIAVQTNATCGLGRVSIINNRCYDLTGAGVFAIPIGVSGANIVNANPVVVLIVEGNEFTDTKGVPVFQYGIYLSGTVTNLYYSKNKFVNMTVLNYNEASFTATNRFGDFPFLSYTPTWDFSGTGITIGNGSLVSAYQLKDDMVTITAVLNIGTTTVIPAGNCHVSLPFPSAISGANYLGTWRIFHAGGFYTGPVDIDGTASIAQLQQGLGATQVTQASPVALASADKISVSVTYRRTTY